MSKKKTELDEQESNNSEYMQKKVAFYQTFVGAWVQTKMEADKQLLTLSALAIGLLMFFYDRLDNVLQLVLWLSAGGLFIGTVITVLFIFLNNSTYIEYVINEDQEHDIQKKAELKIKAEIMSKKIERKTACAFGMFIISVVITFVLAIAKTDFMITKM